MKLDAGCQAGVCVAMAGYAANRRSPLFVDRVVRPAVDAHQAVDAAVDAHADATAADTVRRRRRRLELDRLSLCVAQMRITICSPVARGQSALHTLDAPAPYQIGQKRA